MLSARRSKRSPLAWPPETEQICPRDLFPKPKLREHGAQSQVGLAIQPYPKGIRKRSTPAPHYKTLSWRHATTEIPEKCSFLCRKRPSRFPEQPCFGFRTQIILAPKTARDPYRTGVALRFERLRGTSTVLC